MEIALGEILDSEWVRAQFTAPVTSSASEEHRIMTLRYHTTADSSLGGSGIGNSRVINPEPGINRFADPPRGFGGDGFGEGNGVYHHEMLEKPMDIIHIRPGVARFNPLAEFWQNSFDPDVMEAVEYGWIRKAANFVGSLLGFVITAPLAAAGAVYKTLRSLVLGPNASKYNFYYLSPAPMLFWKGLDDMMNDLAIKIGFTGNVRYSDSKTGINGEVDKGFAEGMESIMNAMPGVFSELDISGGYRIDTITLAHRYNMMHIQRSKYLKIKSQELLGQTFSTEQDYYDAIAEWEAHVEVPPEGYMAGTSSKGLIDAARTTLKELAIMQRDQSRYEAIMGTASWDSSSSATMDRVPASSATNTKRNVTSRWQTTGEKPLTATKFMTVDGTEFEDQWGHKIAIDDAVNVGTATNKVYVTKRSSGEAGSLAGPYPEPKGKSYPTDLGPAPTWSPGSDGTSVVKPVEETSTIASNGTVTAGTDLEDDDAQTHSATSPDNSLEYGGFDPVFKDKMGSIMKGGLDFFSLRVDRIESGTITISNSVGPSGIESMFNGTVSAAKNAWFSVNGGNVGDGMIGDTVSAVTDTAKGFVNGLMNGVTGGVQSALFGGKAFVDISDVYQGSTTSMPTMSYAFTSQAISGHPISKLKMLFPVMALIRVASPISAGPRSFMSPYLVNVTQRGKNIVNMGIITSLDLDWGGEAGWDNQDMPCEIKCKFTVTNLDKNFHVNLTSSMSDVYNDDGQWAALTDIFAGVSPTDLDRSWSYNIKTNFARAESRMNRFFSSSHMAFLLGAGARTVFEGPLTAFGGYSKIRDTDN